MKEVIIYHRKLCPYCVKLMKILREREIKFKDIEINDETKKFLKIYSDKDGHFPSPQVKIGEKLIWDYTTEEELADEIERYLK